MYCKSIGPVLLGLLKYDPETGEVTGVQKHTRPDGYVVLEWPKGHKYLAHRVIWAMHHGDPGSMQIDHRDNNPNNNRLGNLRVASQSQNNWNQSMRCTNTSGVKGLHYDKTEKRWIGQIQCNGKHHRKRSRDREVVEQWLITKREELHQQFTNHGG